METFRPVKQFDTKIDRSQLATEWRKWKRSLEYYLAASGITGQREKRNQLLHLGGPDLQDIFDNLPGVNDVPHVTPHPPFYDVAVQQLDAHFQPCRRRTYERHVFRQISQQPEERFGDFVMKLRVQANRCDFDQEGSSVMDSMIIDQIAEKCLSSALRKKILEKDRSLDEVVAIGKTIEDVERQCKELVQTDGDAKAASIVNKVNQQSEQQSRSTYQPKYQPRYQPKYQPQPRYQPPVYQWTNPQRQFRRQSQNVQPRFRTEGSRNFGASRNQQPPEADPNNPQTTDNRMCFACGRRGHCRGSPDCPALEEQCRNCRGYGHRIKWCTKRTNEDYLQGPASAKRIKSVMESTGMSSESDKDTKICFVMGENVFRFKLGGVETVLTIDSGAAANIIDLKTWRMLQENGADFQFSPHVDRSFRAYGSSTPLTMIGMFVAEIEAGDNKVEATFYIAENGMQSLLGDETAKRLKVLKIGFDVGSLQETPKAFPKIKGVLVEIPVDPNIKPVQQGYRRAPFALEDKIAAKLQYLLDNDIIESVHEPSAWVSPIVPVLKDNGEVRLCVDMRRANQAVIRETHPLPIIEELFGGINGATHFSKLDIREAYHQVEISERSRDITTFITKQGLFRYKRLMFGISCAPELFQKVMESILAGLDGVVVYLDDVLVTGRTQQEHDDRLKALLARIQQYGILLNEKKCIFNVSKLEFVGHELSSQGIRPTENRLAAIDKFRPPQNVSELRSFLGLITYVGRFIPCLAEKTAPLRVLLHAGEKFVWRSQHSCAFEEIKKAITETSFLGYYDPKDLCIVVADASPTGLGAVLLQQNSDGITRIISFASKSLTQTEQKYFQTEREALSLVWAVDRFQLYLLGKRFKLITDCKPLYFLFSERSKPCARIERWVLRLQTYSFDIIHEPGTSNLADALSRLSISEPVAFNTADEACILQLAVTGIPFAISVQEVEEESLKDDVLQEVMRSLETGVWSEKTKHFKPFESELCRVENLLLRGDRLVIPSQLRSRILDIAHEAHPGIVVMKKRLRQKVWWPLMDKETESYVKRCKNCTLVSMPNPPEQMIRTKLPDKAWMDLAVDFVGPLPSEHNLLVIIDYFSRFIEVIIMRQITANLTVKALHETFCRFGMPGSLKSDNGPQFISTELQEFCKQFGIEHRKTTPYWPQANGEVERINRSIVKRLKISEETPGSDWQWDLRTFVLMHNSTPHSTTNIAPSVLMFGRKLKDKMPGLMMNTTRILEEIQDRDRVEKMKGAEYADHRRGAKSSDIEEGNIVVTKRLQKENKLSTTFDPEEYIVIYRRGSDVTLKSKESGRVIHRNVSHLKKLISEDDHSNDDLEMLSSKDKSDSTESAVTNTEGTSSIRNEANQTSMDHQHDSCSEAQHPSKRPQREVKPPTYLKDYKINHFA